MQKTEEKNYIVFDGQQFSLIKDINAFIQHCVENEDFAIETGRWIADGIVGIFLWIEAVSINEEMVDSLIASMDLKITALHDTLALLVGREEDMKEVMEAKWKHYRTNPQESALLLERMWDVVRRDAQISALYRQRN